MGSESLLISLGDALGTLPKHRGSVRDKNKGPSGRLVLIRATYLYSYRFLLILIIRK
ncbi:hypothetical protein CpB0483 [Chlamydia pneumoniae TW-183]|uniref:Uncharacterized protein n=1 Tax=Chlamydia pneumoniae TaxID=83558 RepID=A0ABN3YRB1_CHLPN|nr:hypothetical protein CpB0483 [Chlamydia pneumoniae TW-183]